MVYAYNAFSATAFEGTRCPDCGSTKLVEMPSDGDGCVCSNCGLVVEAGYVDNTAEWRTYSDSTVNPNRVGAAGGQGFWASHALDLQRPTDHRLGRVAGRVARDAARLEGTAPSRSAGEVFQEVRAEAYSLIPNIGEGTLTSAGELFRQFTEHSSMRGPNLRAACVVCLHLAYPSASLVELADLFAVERARAEGMCNTVRTAFAHNRRAQDLFKTRETQELLGHMISTCALLPAARHGELRRKALQLDERIKAADTMHEVASSDAHNINAALIYLAALKLGAPLSKGSVAAEFRLSVATLTSIEQRIYTVLRRTR